MVVSQHFVSLVFGSEKNCHLDLTLLGQLQTHGNDSMLFVAYNKTLQTSNVPNLMAFKVGM